MFLGANGEISTLINAVRVEQDGGIAVFNFTVEGNHNYFILAKEYEYGQTCILVHNANAWYSPQSRKHVYEHGHAANSPPIPDKSRFNPTEGGQKFTDEIINHSNVQSVSQPNGRIKHWVDDLGRNVGRDQNGNLTRGGTVIVEGPNPKSWSTYKPDEVVTQFPK